MSVQVGRKRFKDDNDVDWGDTKRKKDKSKNDSSENCIIHMKNSNMKDFKHIKVSDLSTFKRLQEIAVLRLKQPGDSSNRMEKVCNGIPDYEDLTEQDGYHRDCYQRFTSNLNRLKKECDSNDVTVKKSSRKSTELECMIFVPDCIFCNRVGKISCNIKGYKSTEGTTFFTFGGGTSVQKHAEYLQDEKLLTRIRGYDLFSCEATFHPSCRRKYVNIKRSWRKPNVENQIDQLKVEQVHANAFSSVCGTIEKCVIKDMEVITFSSLLKIYRDEIKGTECENAKYRPEKLKNKIEKNVDIMGKIAFCMFEDDRKLYESCLVYNKEMNMENAVRQSYELGLSLTNKVQETAHELRQCILKAFQAEKDKDDGWPPKPKDQLEFSAAVPDLLQRFFASVISGSESLKSEKSTRLMFSLSQDLCKAATNGQWNLPKHILIGMSLRHLFRSAEVITILNRMGHSADYSYLLELESALAEQLEKSCSLVPNSIIRQPSCKSVFHSDFDNYDEYTNQLTGAGSVHRAHGIMLQEIEAKEDDQVGGHKPPLQHLEKSGKRSFTYKLQEELPDNYFMGIRKNPSLIIYHTTIIGGEEQFKKMMSEGYNWIFLRKVFAENGCQRYPGWSGYVSMLGTTPTRLTTIDYYPVIPFPITDYSTVAETLRFTEEASKEVDQEYHIVTYDLGVCMKAFPLIWNHPEKYRKHLILIGTFHILGGYMKMVGKKMSGSGFEDILIESDLMTSGSMDGVLSGKGYSRAMNCHKALLEALERMLMNKYIEMNKEDSEFQKQLADSKSKIVLFATAPESTAQTLVSDLTIISYIEGYSIE